jgi:hypothetical protein
VTSCVFRKTICSYSRGCIYVAQLLLQSCFWCDQPVTTRIKLERTKMTQIKGQHVDITCMDFELVACTNHSGRHLRTHTCHRYKLLICTPLFVEKWAIDRWSCCCVYTPFYIWSEEWLGLAIACCALSQKYLWHLVILIVWCPRPLAHSAVSA